ncbi:MAG: histidine kinase, partial [Bifidobacteriaceae bacterium]|nr:histidine kinase [Bifidobacteriaceae bacterium]
MKYLRLFVQWCKQYLYPLDICILVIALLATNSNNDGLLFENTILQTQIFNIINILLFMLRRYKPTLCANIFIINVLLQTIFGSVFIITDVFAVPILYELIVRKCKYYKLYFVISLLMGLCAAFTMSWVSVYGSIFATTQQSYCNITNNSQIGYCNIQLTQSLIIFTSIIYFILFLCLISALWKRTQIDTAKLIKSRNQTLSITEEKEREIIKLAERARIARDMHDVVAHSLSIIIIQSDAGKYAGKDNTHIAHNIIRTILQQAKQTRDNMQQLLNVFDTDENHTYDEIASLIQQAQNTSSTQNIIFNSTGTAQIQQLNLQTQYVAYRAVQESLSNIRKYAGNNVTATISEHWDTQGVHLSISDNGRGASANLDEHKSGYGLIGMQERVQAVHGTCSAGSKISGGFEVKIFLPYAKNIDTIEKNQYVPPHITAI